MRKPKAVIEVRISCDLCGLEDLKVYVDERTGSQDVSFWMTSVFGPKVSAAHHAINPDCRPETLSRVKIPLSSRGVGFLPTGDE